MKRNDSFEKTLRLRKIEGRKRRRQYRMRWEDGTTNTKDIRHTKFGDDPMDIQSWQVAVHAAGKRGIRVTD